MSFLTLGPIATVPPTIQQATGEKIPWGIDMTKACSTVPGNTGVNTPTTVLFDNVASAIVTGLGSPTVNGYVVTQVIDGAVLVATHTYTLRITFNVQGATQATTLETVTNLICPI